MSQPSFQMTGENPLIYNPSTVSNPTKKSSGNILTNELYMNSMLSLIFSVKKHLLKMLYVRGYDVSQEFKFFDSSYDYLKFKEEIENKVKSEKVTFKQTLNNIYNSEIDPNRSPMLVLFLETHVNSRDEKVKVGNDQFIEVIKTMKTYSTSSVIMVSETVLTSEVKAKISTMPSDSIEHFLYDELSYDPTEHMFTPRHVLMTEQEIKDEIVSRGIKKEQLPLILASDTISRYYGAKPGQVFKIYRRNITVNTLIENTISYRVVSDISN